MISDKARARFDFIQLYSQAFADSQGNKTQAKKDFINTYNKKAFPEIYRVLGRVGFSSAERWLKTLRDNDNNPDALNPSYNPNRESSISSEQSEILLKCYLSPNKPPASEAIRIAKIIMKTQGVAFAQSDRTFRRYLEKWQSENYDLYIMLREGQKALNDKALPYLERDFNRLEVGDVIVADGHVLNFEAINPFTGKNKRMTLVAFIDMKSSVPLGFEIMPTENVLTIAAALRRSILTLGFIPRVVYLDNGRAFRAKYFQGVRDFRESGLSGLFARLNIETAFAKPYHGQSKTIERFFGTMAELERRIVSYSGNSIENKPARMQRNELTHRHAYNVLTNDKAPEIGAVATQIKSWIGEYIQREHVGGFFQGQSPVEIYSQSLERVRNADDFESRLIEQNALDFLMLESRVSKIYRNGIRFNNRFYWSETLYNRRHEVIIKYDIFEPDNILVFEPDGAFLCEASTADKVHPMAKVLGRADEREQLAERLARQSVLKRNTIDTAKSILTGKVPAIDSGDDLKQLPPPEPQEIDDDLITWEFERDKKKVS